MSPRLRQWIVSRDFIALILIAGIMTAFALTVSVRDFLSYWTAGQQLIHRANPYDADAVARLESVAGFHGPLRSLTMLNPPTALPLALPLGLVGSRTGGLLWSLCLFGCLVASVRMVWTLHGSPPNYIHIIGYCFGPAIAGVLAGQIPLFALLGLALFLRLHRTHPFSAGASLWLCAVKPHLFLPFGVVLIVWVLTTKRYRIALGAATDLSASTAFIWLLDPSAWAQYRQMMHALSPAIAREFIPAWSVVLRRSISPHPIWLQGAPAAVGCIWALWYFFQHRCEWDWLEHGSLLMIVSILVAPYAWLIDQSLLIPALLHGAYRARSRTVTAILASASTLILIQIFLESGVRSRWNLWPAPFWLLWYLWATSARRTGISASGAVFTSSSAALPLVGDSEAAPNPRQPKSPLTVSQLTGP